MKSFLFILILLATNSFASSDRIALVIGNSKYAEFGVLANPANDARDINKVLTEMGYKTRLVLDANESTIRKEFRNFAAQSDSASIAIVFYAGHGAQVNGENFLLPVDMDIPKRDSDIQLSALKVDDVISSIKSKTKVVFLDACRDNPALVKSLSKGRGSYRGGLAPTNSTSLGDQSSGIFVAYATDAGNVASDGSAGEKNSPFTSALLNHIKQPVSIDDMFSMVTKDVRQKTKNAQKPYKYASLDGIVCLPEKCVKAGDSKNNINNVPIKPVTASQSLPLDSSVTWALFQRRESPKQLIYLDPTSVQIFGSRVSVDQKWVNDDDGSFDIFTFAMDCKSLFGNVIKLEKFDSNGKMLMNAVYGNVLTIDLKHDYSNKQTIGFHALQIACNPEKTKLIIDADQLASPDWERFYTVRPGVDIFYLKKSLRSVSLKQSTSIGFLASFIQDSIPSEGELISKLSFPRTKGSDLKKVINVDLGLETYKRVPSASTLVSKVRFICGKNTSYQIIENWFDEDRSLVGYSSVIDVSDKDKLIKNHPDSILSQMSKLVCK